MKDTPLLQVDGQPLPNADATRLEEDIVPFHEALHRLATTAVIHDSLEFGGGLGWMSVLAWRFMEHVPFRRMDLQPDGTRTTRSLEFVADSARLMARHLLAIAARRDQRHAPRL